MKSSAPISAFYVPPTPSRVELVMFTIDSMQTSAELMLRASHMLIFVLLNKHAGYVKKQFFYPFLDMKVKIYLFQFIVL